MSEYDVVVVGSGACGGIAAKQLTDGGARVLMLEAGPDLTASSGEGADEESTSAKVLIPLPPGLKEEDLEGMSEATRLALTPGNWRHEVHQILSIVLGWPRARPQGNLAAAERLATHPRQPIQSQVGVFGPQTNELFVDDVDNPYMAPSATPFIWIRGRVLGGRMQTWQRKAPRVADHTFEAPIQGGYGEPWPIRARDLQPYYEIAERLMRVTGAVESGAPQYEGALPARPLSPAEERFKQAIESRWPERRIQVVPHASPHGPEEEGDNEPAPPYDNGRHPSYDCPVRCTIAPAIANGRLTVRTDSVVRHIELDPMGNRASGVVYVDAETGQRREARARVIVLCASTLESTRILLNSRSERNPEGLANSSGVLGRYLMDHLFGIGAIGIGRARAEPPPRPPLWISPFRNAPGDDAGHGFLGSYQLSCAFAGMRAGLLHRYRQILTISADGEVLPRFENRVTIDQNVVDRWGIPVLRIEYAYGENELAMCRDMSAVIDEMMEAAGYRVFFRSRDPLPPGMSIHELGTARMGSDPRSSVVDPFCRTWDVENLYVTDGAVFPSAGCQNPTLAMMALTARACDHILHRLARGEL